MSLPVYHMVASGPRPVAPFSHAVEAKGFVFITGQMPTDPDHPDAPLPEGVEAQTKRVIANLQIILAGLDLGLEHVVMARIYLTNFDRDYADLNQLWPSFFPSGNLPARTTVGVNGLAVGAVVEIDFIAARP